MDPLLASLRYENTGVFDLTRNLASISIRDQMVRASMVSRALPVWLRQRYQENYGAKPVLVAGGGACGMTLAVGLAMEGVKVEVVDPASVPFELQRNCISRWLDVLQYDWPMDHWGHGVFPWQRAVYRAGRVIPFRCPADWSSNLVANTWDTDLNNHLTQSYAANLVFHWGRRILVPPSLDPQDNLVVYLGDHQQRCVYSGTYHAVVLAFGFGLETCRSTQPSQFVGSAFWESDSFEQTSSGISPAPGADTVVISGTGDGGLQDFLRVMTRQPSAHKIFDDLNLADFGVEFGRIHTLDQRLERATAWVPPQDPNGSPSQYPFSRVAYVKERDSQCLLVIRRVLNQAPGLRDTIVRYLAQRPKKTVLVSRSEYFDCLYIFNLFLSRLLIECLWLDPDVAIQDSVEILKESVITGIASSNPLSLPQHQQLVAQQCIGHPWDVSVTHADGQQKTMRADVVIIRHGVGQAANIHKYQTSPTSHPRPMPPTHLH